MPGVDPGLPLKNNGCGYFWIPISCYPSILGMHRSIKQKAIDFIFFQIEQKRWEGFISLITFSQVLYFSDKKLGNPKNAAKRAYGYLKVLQLTPFNPALLLQLDIDSWPDYEGGLQYVCALSGDCEAIITTNTHNFYASNLLIIDPLNFVVLYGE